MFIGGDGWTKGNGAQLLQDIREGVISWIAVFPQTIALRKLLGSEGGETKQIIGTILATFSGAKVARPSK